MLARPGCSHEALRPPGVPYSMEQLCSRSVWPQRSNTRVAASVTRRASSPRPVHLGSSPQVKPRADMFPLLYGAGLEPLGSP